MKPKLIIAISGGLDSFMSIYWTKEVFCPKNNIDWETEVALLQVNDSTNPYGLKEQLVISKLYEEFKFKIITMNLNGFTHYAKTNDHVILGRNAVIASLGASFAPLVFINGTAFEDNKGMYDKNNRFFTYISRALDYATLYKRQIGDTIILSPFQRMSGKLYPFKFQDFEKTDMIHWLESIGLYDWRETTSCFHPTKKRCGKCDVCGKRYVYEKYVELKFNIFFDKKLPLEKTYASNPRNIVSLWNTYEKMSNDTTGRYNSRRLEIYQTVLGKVK